MWVCDQFKARARSGDKAAADEFTTWAESVTGGEGSDPPPPQVADDVRHREALDSAYLAAIERGLGLLGIAGGDASAPEWRADELLTEMMRSMGLSGPLPGDWAT